MSMQMLYYISRHALPLDLRDPDDIEAIRTLCEGGLVHAEVDAPETSMNGVRHGLPWACVLEITSLGWLMLMSFPLEMPPDGRWPPSGWRNSPTAMYVSAHSQAPAVG